MVVDFIYLFLLIFFLLCVIWRSNRAIKIKAELRCRRGKAFATGDASIRSSSAVKKAGAKADKCR